MSRERGPAKPVGKTDGRGASPVVGVVLLVGVTVALAAAAGAALAFGSALGEAPPRAASTDGWPDGQRLRVVHESGDAVPVGEVALVVELDRVDAHARLTGFPTRRLTGEHVRGRDAFDGTYAGIDGALDAAHTDGTWDSGEAASVRIAQGEVDVRPGDGARVTVVHRPTNTVLGRVAVTAE
ncbi:hypothetical protein BRC70_06530 [Halobacteriales archaeon QH_6_68_27]|nr:MAG: hypothetical protein BRC70_06530 [Halobacteriales archaeon QH_6_68_27]